MQRPVFAANWKMNHGPTAARAFIAAFAARWTPRDDRTVIFFPPALSVTTVVARARVAPRSRRRRAEHLDRGQGRVHRRELRADGARRGRAVRARRSLGAATRVRRNRRADGAQVRGGGAQRAHADPLRRRDARAARGGRDRTTVVLRQLARWTWRSFRRTPSRRWRSRTSRSGRSERARPRRRTTRPRCTP